MRPGVPIPLTSHTGLPGSGKSILPMPAAEQPGGGDTSDAEHDPNGAIQMVALVEDRPITLHDLETFLNLLKHVAGPKLLRLTGLVALADDLSGRSCSMPAGLPSTPCSTSRLGHRRIAGHA